MSRSVGNDELTFVCREIAVGHVDGDTFLAFCLKAVEQQGIVYAVAGVAHAFAVAFEGCELVVVELLGVEEQTSDKRRFSIIDASCCQQAQQVFLFVCVEIGFNIKL